MGKSVSSLVTIDMKVPVTAQLVTIVTIYVTITDYEQIVKLSDEFNGADLRNVCTEAGQ